MTSERNAEIKRLYEQEKWPIGTIANHFCVHYSTVKRAIHGLPKKVKESRPLLLEPYKEFIRETLNQYPQIKATRVWAMIRERGYQGLSPTPVQDFVKQIRPSPPQEAFLRLKMLPGEQAQVDWGYFGRFDPHDPYSRKIMGFVMTLAYSRMIFLKFFLCESSTHFIQGHLDAFEYFGGVPRNILIDNLKTGVTERIGSLIQFNESYLTLSRHSGFRPLAANVRRGNEKGRVERSIRYIRDSFFAARNWKSIPDLNQQAEDWCTIVSGSRKWHEDRNKTVFDAFGEEKLLPLPGTRYYAIEKKITRVGKTPYIRYDCNDYSVPAHLVGKIVEVQACTEWVHVALGVERVTTHARSYGKRLVLEHEDHLKEVLDSKQRAKKHSELHRLKTLFPQIDAFLELLAAKDGSLVGKIKQIQQLEREYGQAYLSCAMAICVKDGRGSLSTLKLLVKQLERQEQRSCDAQLPIPSGQVVKQHDPSIYENLTKEQQ